MRIAFLTTNDPLYLPAFFKRVLAQCAAQTQSVYVVPPLYKQQTSSQAAWRYYRSFGTKVFMGLGFHILRAKIKGESIASVCRRHKVKYESIPDVNAPVFLDQLRREAPDVLVSVSCPQIFKTPLIGLPSRGILNIHGAILPHYRGVMPSFWMMANGEKQAGVSIYFVNEQIDAGGLCAQRAFNILPDETLNDFLRRSKSIAADLLLGVLSQMNRGNVPQQPLNLSEGSYYSWPDAKAYKKFCAAGRQFW
ncbi:MAG: fmt [Pedosphaera sp.]|nr:fmt [Pedosphaera sp.]